MCNLPVLVRGRGEVHNLAVLPSLSRGVCVDLVRAEEHLPDLQASRG